MNNTYSNNDIVIVEATRSILGATNGSLKNLSAAELGHFIIEGLLLRLEKKSIKFSRKQIQSLIIGQCIGSGIGQNLPRQIARLCHMGNIESSFVVNEMCGSSLETIIIGIQTLKIDEYPMMIVGGIEMPSASPYFITTQQLIDWKYKSVEEIQTMVVKSDMHDALWCKMHNVHTIVHAENTTEEWVKKNRLNPDQFKREIDEWAVLSHDRALKAIEEDVFKEEITIIPDTSQNDELPAKKNIDRLLRRSGTHFTPNGKFLTNFNSPPLANAAAFIMIMKYKEACKFGFTPMARIIDYAKVGVKPEKFLLALNKAVLKLLEKTSTTINDYDLMELNTAFGSQMLINKKELNLDMDKVNIYGDCIAFGHPIGAAGTRLTTTLLYALKRNKKNKGIVSICLGGGNALAIAIENLNN